MRRLSLRRFARAERGAAAASFVIMLPLVFGVFLLSFDSGFAAVRASLLERSMDMTARSLRNGTITQPTLANIKTDLCSRMTFFANCSTMLKVQIVSVPRPAFTTPSRGITCADQGAMLTPVRSFVTGQTNPIAVLRACMEITTVTPVSIFSTRPFSYRIHAETALAGTAS